ncbi:MAG: polysaccharide lyase 8 family protein, partial [Sedimentisphaerales bacterium]|nr:polysaccharide lyase 8 family protein [Sedimentisphaerales bacterium]
TDMDTLRANWLAFHTGATADASDPNVQASLNDLSAIAQFRRDTIAADGSWPDLDYDELEDSDWDPQWHYRYIYWMSVAWHTPNQALYHDDSLWPAVEKALDYGYNNLLSETLNISGNWWWNEIGVPMYLGPALLLAEGKIDADIYADAKSTFYARIYSAPHMDGQNAIWSAMNHLVRALLDDDAARMALVKAEFVKQCTVNTSGEGVKPDYSFHQHGNQLQTGAYGSGFALDVGEYLIYVTNTSYMLAESQLDVYANYILVGTAWSRYRNRYDISVRGRNITRGDEYYNCLPTGPDLGELSLAQIPGWWQQSAVALAKRSFATNPDIDSTLWGGTKRYRYHNVSSYIKNLQTEPTPAKLWKGYKHFNYSEHSVSRRNDWYASMRMLSNRCVSTENTNNENKKGWCLSDGVTWIYLTNNEYTTNNVMPTLDWQRLPGITVERKPRSAGEGFGYGTEAFVGGTGTDDFGVSAMKFNANASEVTALKSYFFFDDEMVCLGTDIQCPTTNPIETVVDQRRMLDGAPGVTINGTLNTDAADWEQTLSNPTWVQANDMGYYFPTPCNVMVSRQMQSGEWHDLTVNNFPPLSVFTNDILTLRFEHGVTPTDGQYAYAVIPGADTATMAAYTAQAPFAILAQDEKAHAVRDISTNAVGIVFWEAGKIGAVRTNYPCIVFYRHVGDVLTVTVSEPARTTDDFWLTFNELYEPVSLPDGFVLSNHAGQSSVKCLVASGQSYQLTLRKKKAVVLIDDDFSNNTVDRRNGDPLVGTATPIDGRLWSTDMPGDYVFDAEGHVYHQSGVEVRSVCVVTPELAGQIVRMEAKVRFSAGVNPETAYAILATWRPPHLNFTYVSGLSSELYLRIRANGLVELSAMNGAYRPTNIGNIISETGQTPLTLPQDVFFPVWLSYDPLTNRLSAGVADEVVLLDYPLDDVIVDDARGYTLMSNYAGFQLEPDTSDVCIDSYTINTYNPAASEACRGAGYYSADFNDNCIVDLEDLQYFLQQWLLCNSTEGSCF